MHYYQLRCQLIPIGPRSSVVEREIPVLKVIRSIRVGVIFFLVAVSSIKILKPLLFSSFTAVLRRVQILSVPGLVFHLTWCPIVLSQSGECGPRLFGLFQPPLRVAWPFECPSASISPFCGVLTSSEARHAFKFRWKPN